VTGATAEPLLLRQNDRDELVGLTRSSSVGAGLAARARIVLLAAALEIARLVGVSRATVNAWRTRYAERGLSGLADEQRSGRKRSIDQRRIVAETLRPPPAGLGVTHWSSRLLADRLGTSHVTVAAAWKRYGVKPWKAETFKFSTDPEPEAKVTDNHRVIPGAAGERDRVVLRREKPDSSVEPDSEDLADAARLCRAAHL
jgi:transposase